MLVDRFLSTGSAVRDELRYRNGAEEGLATQDDLRRHKTLPAGAGRLVGVEVVRQGEQEVVVRHQGGKAPVEVRGELLCGSQLGNLVELLLEVRFERADVEGRKVGRVEPAPDDPLDRQGLHFEFVASDQVERVVEDQRVLGSDLARADVSGFPQGVQEGFPIVQVEDAVQRLAELLEVLRSRLRRGLARFEILASQDLVCVAKAAAFEAQSDGGSDDVRRGRLDEVVVRRPVRRHVAVLAELLDARAHLRLVDRQQGHDEVVLLEGLALRIDSHEDLRDHLLVGIGGNLERREQVALEPEQGVYALLDEVFLLVRQLGFALLGIALVELADEGLPEGAQPVLLVGGESLAHR